MKKTKGIIIKSIVQLFLSIFLIFSCSSENSKPHQKSLPLDQIKYPLPKKLSQNEYIEKLKN